MCGVALSLAFLRLQFESDSQGWDIIGDMMGLLGEQQVGNRSVQGNLGRVYGSLMCLTLPSVWGHPRPLWQMPYDEKRRSQMHMVRLFASLILGQYHLADMSVLCTVPRAPTPNF